MSTTAYNKFLKRALQQKVFQGYVGTVFGTYKEWLGRIAKNPGRVL